MNHDPSPYTPSEEATFNAISSQPNIRTIKQYSLSELKILQTKKALILNEHINESYNSQLHIKKYHYFLSVL